MRRKLSPPNGRSAGLEGINSCTSCFEKQQEIDRLTEENLSLRQKLYQRARREKLPFGSSTPSSKIPIKPNSEQENRSKVGGGVTGHIGHGRKSASSQSASAEISIKAALNCPRCGGQLRNKGERQRTVLELDPVEPKKILYHLEKKYCSGCRHSVEAQAPGVLPKSLYGNQLVTEIITNHYLHGMPLGRICQKLGLNLGSVIDALHRTANIFRPIIPKLIEQYRRSAVRHADETSWRTDGKSGYAWLFCTTDMSIFLYRDNRSAKVPREVLGDKKLDGVLLVDRYAGYNRAPCQLQYCYAHLLRDVENIAKEFPDDGEAQNFTSRLISLLTQAMHLRSEKITDRQYYQRARKLQQQISALNDEKAVHSGIIHIQEIFQENAHRLYHWVASRAVPAENNLAERELRPTVIARKVSFGSQSDAGARTREVWMTVLHTLKRRSDKPLERLKSALDQIAIEPDRDPFELLFAQNTG